LTLSYGSISLLNSLCKVFRENKIAKQANFSIKIIKLNQRGPVRLQEDHSTAHALTRIVESTALQFNNNKAALPALFLDTGRDFDKVRVTGVTNRVAPEPEGSSPHSQQPANGPYPEPAESTPHPPNQSP
jgi:hypothetical protein